MHSNSIIMVGIHIKHGYMIFVKNYNGYYTLIFHWGSCHLYWCDYQTRHCKIEVPKLLINQ